MTDDLAYRNDEWEFDGALICADIELTLTVEPVDGFGIGAGDPRFTLYTAVIWHGTEIRPAWLAPLMTAWVERNQPTLAQSYQDRRVYREAAE